ncbi:M15 family metallopeptidase [Microbacterium sp. A93]|uniref:M15 family metallopeptidase n=1 Tax=Microbacterium sp. A93 TaxID=3450716 RepID=UPI003F44489B
MNTTPMSPAVRRRRRILLPLVFLALAVIAAFAVQQSLAVASAPSSASISGAGALGEVTEADGAIRDGGQPSVFDDASPAVEGLRPDLLAALRSAATDARADGVEFWVNSGWRSQALQAQLLREAVVTYGSEEEAARWVAKPETSSHVTGEAVDIGPLRALDWLAQHGANYGLCQTYSNESWHYELRPEAIEAGCPQSYADPTEDPRLQ